jgi:hypothetical protein
LLISPDAREQASKVYVAYLPNNKGIEKGILALIDRVSSINSLLYSYLNKLILSLFNSLKSTLYFLLI